MTDDQRDDLMIRVDTNLTNLVKIVEKHDEKIESLETSMNRIKGAGGVLALLAGAAEWLIHRKP